MPALDGGFSRAQQIPDFAPGPFLHIPVQEQHLLLFGGEVVDHFADLLPQLHHQVRLLRDPLLHLLYPEQRLHEGGVPVRGGLYLFRAEPRGPGAEQPDFDLLHPAEIEADPLIQQVGTAYA